MPKVKVNSLSLYYEESGQGDPILWINGLGGDHTSWVNPVAEFGKHYRCITFDNRDAGRSDQASSSYTLFDMAEDAEGLLSALGITSAHIVGYSMGGAIAQALAINFPQKVRSLTLVCTYTKGDPRGTAMMNSWRLMRAKFPREEYFRAILPWIFTYQNYLAPGLVEDYLRRALENPYPQSAEAFARQAEAVSSFDSEDKLPTIKAPTLIIAGDEDILTPIRFAHALQKGIPHAKLYVVNGAGHGLLVSHPQEFAQAFLKFLKNLRPT